VRPVLNVDFRAENGKFRKTEVAPVVSTQSDLPKGHPFDPTPPGRVGAPQRYSGGMERQGAPGPATLNCVYTI
jgi:hypothetical protein